MRILPDEAEFYGVNGDGRTDAYQQLLSAFDFENEAAACDKLDELVLQSGCFNIHREIRGYYVHIRPGCDSKRPRIDRILSPTAKLLDAGWPHGPLGIECKTSGKKMGRCITQAENYGDAVWEMPRGYLCYLRWIFIWPLDGAKGDLGSVMAQNRIGYLTSSNRCILQFGCGGTVGIRCNSDGTVQAKELAMGNKLGSR
jgi:hypothetical protein